MRYARILPLFFALLPIGCSGAACIAWVGTDLSDLKTKDDVHGMFGDPTAFGPDGASMEKYHTRRKFNDPNDTSELMELCSMTFGLADFITFPSQVYQAMCNICFGQDVWFTYNGEGKVTGVYRRLDENGRPIQLRFD
jgi:hypothetical protein